MLLSIIYIYFSILGIEIYKEVEGSKLEKFSQNFI